MLNLRVSVVVLLLFFGVMSHGAQASFENLGDISVIRGNLKLTDGLELFGNDFSVTFSAVDGGVSVSSSETGTAPLTINGPIRIIDGNQENGRVLISDAQGNGRWEELSSGLQGPPGPQGPQGSTGPQGATGPQGPAGSAFSACTNVSCSFTGGTSCTATCPSGFRVVSGGFRNAFGVLISSFPSSASSWTCARSVVGSGGAICDAICCR